MRFLTTSIFLGLVCIPIYILSLSLSYSYSEEVLGKMPTSLEMKQLPEYLQVRMKYLWERGKALKDPVYVKWQARFGDDYQYLHHYGYGLNYMNRVARGNVSTYARKFYLKRAVDELDFVTRHSSKKLPILCQVHAKKGEALMMLDKVAEAVPEFMKAIKLKPDYFYAYLKLSQCYTACGDLEKAEEVLKIGARKASRSKQRSGKSNPEK